MTEQLELDCEALRQELRLTLDALLALRARLAAEDRDELVIYFVKVPAQRGWHRWKKEVYRSAADAIEAAKVAAVSHSRARVVERRSLVRERIIHTASAIEARSDKTQSGSAEGESAVPQGDAQ